MDTIATCALRAALVEYFDQAPKVLQRLREAGDIPAGRPGRGGALSARLDARQCALVLLALGSGVAPVDTPAAARELAVWRLRYRDFSHSSGPAGPRRVHLSSGLCLLDVLACEIRSAAGELPDFLPSTWVFGSHEASQLQPERLVFAEDAAPSVAPLAERQVIVNWRVLDAIADLFRPLTPSVIGVSALEAAAVTAGMGRG